jgi:hypothetical protein
LVWPLAWGVCISGLESVVVTYLYPLFFYLCVLGRKSIIINIPYVSIYRVGGRHIPLPEVIKSSLIWANVQHPGD